MLAFGQDHSGWATGPAIHDHQYGEVLMTNSQRAQLDQCLGEWSERVPKKLKAIEDKQ